MKKGHLGKQTVVRAGAYQPPRYEFKVSRTLPPGARGTQRHVEEFHESLYCVRYRDDDENNLRFTTVELIRDVRPLKRSSGPFGLEETVSIWPTGGDTQLAQKLKRWGGNWDEQRKCWLVKYKVARKLRIAKRARKVPAAPTT